MAVGDVHVLPVDDLKGHICSIECWCAPHVEEIGANVVVTHHAADMREYSEPGGPAVPEVPRG